MGVTAESCAVCNTPYREHLGQFWDFSVGWHGWIAPSKEQIAARIRYRYWAKGRLR